MTGVGYEIRSELFGAAHGGEVANPHEDQRTARAGDIRLVMALHRNGNTEGDGLRIPAGEHSLHRLEDFGGTQHGGNPLPLRFRAHKRLGRAIGEDNPPREIEDKQRVVDAFENFPR